MGNPTFAEVGTSISLLNTVIHSPEPAACNPALRRLQSAKSVLLLQGPVGAFFDRLATWLMQQGTLVKRIALQGGDVHDSRRLSPILFKKTFNEWPDFLAQKLQEHHIDCVVLFGQSRRYHQVAIDLCKRQGLTVVVLEEGYFRPGFITMELGGVNGFSDTLKRYSWHPALGSASIQPDISPYHFQKMAVQASLHYQAMWNARHQFAHYQHHRISQPRHYFVYWMRSWLRKITHTRSCRRVQQKLFDGRAKQPYYFVPLQHDGDAQIVHHSHFPDNVEFILRVIHSFERHAPAHSLLVFRQHPHVRGGLGHGELIAGLSQELGIAHRVHHMVEGDTPDLAEHSAGVVLINSTVGLQALERGAPLMVLGEALYKQPHLTFMGELDQFWHQGRPPCPQETASFLAQIKNLTQAPVSVYARRGEPITWDAVLAAATTADTCNARAACASAVGVSPVLSLVRR